MEKSEQRNEIIRVFRKFARLGLDSERLNPAQIYKKIDVVCVSRRARLDMLAVYDTLRLLWLNDETEIMEALKCVYFSGKEYRLTKYDLSSRVLALANDNYCDERPIYRRLERASSLYLKIREREGLLDAQSYP
jgi:hypothetical protein